MHRRQVFCFFFLLERQRNLAALHRFCLVVLTGSDINNTSTTISHVAIVAPMESPEKVALASDLIEHYTGSGGRTLIFTRTKAEADRLALELGPRGLPF